MNCSPSSLAKYKSRPGPPIPATLCTLGDIKLGNDGNKYQIVEVNSRSGLTLKWQKCGTGSTNCKLVKTKKSLPKATIKSKVKKETIKAKKQTKSEALKLRNEVYKIWDKVAKKSKKRYDDEEYLIPHPDGLAWGYGTDSKYFDWEACVAKDRPKRECNKIVTMLKQDLSKMNKALEKVNKPKKIPVKSKKPSFSKKTKKKCPHGKVVNPKTGRCINQLKKIDKLLTKANSKLSKAMSSK